MAWDLSCHGWEERLREGRSLVPDLPLITEEADMAVEFFNNLRLPDVVGLPYLRDAAGEWQRDIVRAVFGSYNPIDDERYINEFLTLVAKKNSKTSSAAAIMVTALLMNRRPLADFILVAPTQEVSGKPFSQAAGMIRADPALDSAKGGRFKVIDHIKEIRDLTNGATLKVKSFSPEVLTGSIASGVLVDELHVIGKMADADQVMIQVRGGYMSNPSMFLIFITTQSDEPPEGVFKQELYRARAIRDGQTTGELLPILYEFPKKVQESDEWRNPSLWAQVNPNLGRSVSFKRLKTAWDKAQFDGKSEEILFASQHLNVEVGIGISSDRWAGVDFFKDNADPKLATNPMDVNEALSAMLERCEVAVVGVDGGGLDDLLGVAVLGRELETRNWLLWSHAWAHEIVLERRKSEAAKLRDFEKDGDLTIVAKPGDDVMDVADIIMTVEESGLLPKDSAVGVDSVGIGDIVDELTAREFDKDRVIGISQGWRLNGAIKTTERKLAGGTLKHGGLRLMNWCVANAKIEPAGNAVKITKQTAGTAKIDPLCALFDAVELMSRNPEAERSIYEDEDIFV